MMLDELLKMAYRLSKLINTEIHEHISNPDQQYLVDDVHDEQLVLLLPTRITGQIEALNHIKNAIATLEDVK